MDTLDINMIIAQIEQGRNVPEPKILAKTPLTLFIDKQSAAECATGGGRGQDGQQQAPSKERQSQNPGETSASANSVGPNANAPAPASTHPAL